MPQEFPAIAGALRSERLALAIQIETRLTRPNASCDRTRESPLGKGIIMESNNVENSMTRLSTMGPQAPPDVSASRRSHTSKDVTQGVPTAVVYSEGNFGQVDGKTANGLVRHSQAYRILSVIDGRLEGRDSGQVLDEVSNGIPILEDLEAAVAHEVHIPDTLIYGMAPSTGRLSPADRSVVLNAIGLGMNIVSGLHEYLSDDHEIARRVPAALFDILARNRYGTPHQPVTP